MSYLKIVNELFLGQEELNRFRTFLDDKGWRFLLIKNLSSSGLLQYPSDTSNGNFKVEEGTNANTIKIAQESYAIDEDGMVIVKSAENNIEVPNDGAYYWVKIAHAYSAREVGTFAIDANGNLTGDSNAKLTEILRGQPNFASKIVFLNSTNNTQEYSVQEVIDDQNAVLQGSFIAETQLQIAIVGTFTPGKVPLLSEKYPFQYDSCTLTLVEETVLNTAPAKTDGKEFYIARVRIDGGALEIEDKRTEVYESSDRSLVTRMDVADNPLIGVEGVQWQTEYDTREKNLILLAWGFRSSNWTIDANTRKLTFNAGNGGVYHDTNDFTNGDFDGWRLYAANGTYRTILSSIRVGSQINLTLDVLDPDDYGVNDTLLAVPDVEEIEIFVGPDNADVLGITAITQDVSTGYAIIETSTPHGFVQGDEVTISDTVVPSYNDVFAIYQVLTTTTFIVPVAYFSDAVGTVARERKYQQMRRNYVFPVNTQLARIEALVAHEETTYDVNLIYRYKNHAVYTETKTFPNNANGYYDEQSYDEYGDLKGSGTTLVTYTASATNGFITLTPNARHFKQLIETIYLGENLGVSAIDLQNSTVLYQCTVGTTGKHVYVTRTDPVLSTDLFIELNKFDSDGKQVRAGSEFYLYLDQLPDPSTFNLRVVEDYVDPSTYSELLNLSYWYFYHTSRSNQQPYLRCTFDGESWDVRSASAVLDQDWSSNYVLEANYSEIAGNTHWGLGWRQDPRTGFVHMRGAIQADVGFAGPNDAFTINDVGLRPKKQFRGCVAAVGVGGYDAIAISIALSGVVTIEGPHQDVICFDGIHYLGANVNK